MSRKFVDSRWIRARMDRKDARVNPRPRMLPAFLRSESFPYASVEIIRAPVSETSRTSETPVEITGDPAAWHAFLAAPGTGAQLDALLEDFAAIDAAQAEADALADADRDGELLGSTCGVNCGFCGSCS